MQGIPYVHHGHQQHPCWGHRNAVCTMVQRPACLYVLQVIDEADTVLSGGWGEEVAQLLKPLQVRQHLPAITALSPSQLPCNRTSPARVHPCAIGM